MSMETTTQGLFLDQRQVAAFLGVSVSFVQRLRLSNKEFPKGRILVRRRMWLREDVERWVSDGKR